MPDLRLGGSSTFSTFSRGAMSTCQWNGSAPRGAVRSDYQIAQRDLQSPFSRKRGRLR